MGFFSRHSSEGGDKGAAAGGSPQPPVARSLPPLTDITDADAAQLDQLEKTLGGTVNANRDKLTENGSKFDAIQGLFDNADLPPVDRNELLGIKKEKSAGGGPGSGPAPTTIPPVEIKAGTKPQDLPLISADDPIVQQCFELLRAGKIEEFNSLRPAGRLDMRGLDLTGANLAGADLRYADLTRAVFHKADLTGAKVQHAILDRSDLSNTKLDGAQFLGAFLRYSDLRDVQSAKAVDLRGANLRGAELSGGNFSGALFSDAVLISATLERGNFSGAEMERVHLGGAVLTRANFEKANLSKARLFQSNGQDINFSGANLCEAIALQASFSSSNRPLSEDKVQRTSFDGAWTRGMQRDEALSAELLHGAIADKFPPEGTFKTSPDPVDEKILVDGIPGTDKVLYDAAMEELNELVGLKEVKQYIKNMMSLLKASQSRGQFGLPKLDYTLHRAYTGNPGTGKTTVARIQSKLLFSLGCLSKGHLVETDKTGLIAGYQGQTLEKTNNLVNSAIGGSLLIDEAYALTNSKDDSYAKDALAVLTKRLEDDRDKFCCLVCGYTKQMREFMRANPGLFDRFDDFVEFPDYTSGELVDIMKLRLAKKHFRVDAEFLAASSVLFAARKAQQGETFSNGRAVRKAEEKMEMLHSVRIDSEGKLKDRESLVSPRIDDLPFEKLVKTKLSEFPPLSELRWKTEDGKEVGVKELSLDGSFPCLTEESVARIAEVAKSVAQEVEEEEAKQYGKSL